MNKVFIGVLSLCFLLVPYFSVVPFAVGLLSVAYVRYRNSWVFLAALFGGIFLDVITVDRIGFSSMYLLIFLLLIFAYERKFEIQTREFVLLVSLIGSVGYLLVVKQQIATLSGLLVALVSVSIFELFTYFNTPTKEQQL